MAQRSAFFDSQNGDRPYAAADWSRVFASLTGRDGVIAGDGDELAVSPTSPVSMAVQVGLGSAWIQGRHYNLYSAAEVLEIPEADSTNPRIDRIVLRMDTAVSARKIEVYVKEGTPAAEPSPPSLTRDTEAWEISLAQVLVEANATEIEAADITDERGDEQLCGFINLNSTDALNAAFYGAVGDGATDDTVAIQRGIDAAIATGYPLLIPAGTYITSNLNIDASCMIVISQDATLVRKAETTGSLIAITGDHVTIEGGGCIDGNKANASGAQEIHVAGDHCTVRDIEIKNAKTYGIYVTGDYNEIEKNNVHDSGNIAIFLELGASYNRVEGNKVIGTDAEGGIKVHGDGTSIACIGNKILANHVEDVAQICIEVWGLSPRSVIEGNTTIGGMMGISVDLSHHTTVTGNQIYDPSEYGIELANSKYCSVTGNTVVGDTNRITRGVSVTNTSPTHNTIQANTIVHVERGIHVQDGGFCAISDNIIDDYNNYAINLSGASHSTIANNVITNGGMKVIMIDNSSNITISANAADGAGENGIMLFQNGEGETDHIMIVGNRMTNVNVAIGEQGTIGDDVEIWPTPAA